MEHLKLSQLYPYLTWNCPLVDDNFASILGRIITSYVGKTEITLTTVNYQPHNLILTGKGGNHDRDPNVKFDYRTCCVSSNGCIYVIEDELYQDNKKYKYYSNDYCQRRNLKYIGSKNLNKYGRDAKLRKNTQLNKLNDGMSSYHKYMRTIDNKSCVTRKYTRICVIDFTNNQGNEANEYSGWVNHWKYFEKNQWENSDNDSDSSSSSDRGRSVHDGFKFSFFEPLAQRKDTIMIFVNTTPQKNSLTIFIENENENENKRRNGYGYYDSLEKKENDKNTKNGGYKYIEFGLYERIMDIWQCNKRAYVIVKEKMKVGGLILKLIKISFTRVKVKVKEKKSNTNGKTKNGADDVVRYRYKVKKEEEILYMMERDIEINENCNYYDLNSQSLLVVENNKAVGDNGLSIDSSVKIRLVCKQVIETKQEKETETDKKKEKGKVIGKPKKKSLNGGVSRIRPKASKTKRAKPIPAKVKGKVKGKVKVKSSKSKNKVLDKSDKVKVETSFDEIVLKNKFLQLLFDNSKCDYLCYHKPSKTFILVLKILDTMSDEQKEDEKEKEKEKEKEDRDNNASNVFPNVNSIDSMSGYLEWKEKIICFNTGRILLQLSIDFKDKCVINSRIGYIGIDEDKYRIIGYDETRSMIIYDTLPSIARQWEVLADKSYCNKKKVSPNDILMDKWNYHKVSWSGHNSTTKQDDEVRIHNYKMMRINDLVDRWIDLS